MLRIYNTLSKTTEAFHPVNKKIVRIFTCGPSVYQSAHIGNFRTYLFEDILVRYLEYSGFKVKRGMNFTDIEDKALKEAARKKISVKHLTDENIRKFIHEMKLLKMKVPDYLPRASDSVSESVAIIRKLVRRNIAYWYRGNVYFDPLKFPGFGRLYGLDMTVWPKNKRRFHKDTYPGMQWNLGDFILWHGYKKGDIYYWDTDIGRGRPSWNIQDPGMIIRFSKETLSVYCGGIDNLYRHHDYIMAVLESVRPYPVAKYWLHCNHLHINGQKMSKSKGNIIFTETLVRQEYSLPEIRFFLIYGHYRDRINYTQNNMRRITDRLRELKKIVRKIKERAEEMLSANSPLLKGGWGDYKLKKAFSTNMDNDLDVRGAVDELIRILSGVRIDRLRPGTASGIIKTLTEIDEVLRVIF